MEEWELKVLSNNWLEVAIMVIRWTIACTSLLRSGTLINCMSVSMKRHKFDWGSLAVITAFQILYGLVSLIGKIRHWRWRLVVPISCVILNFGERNMNGTFFIREFDCQSTFPHNQLTSYWNCRTALDVLGRCFLQGKERNLIMISSR